MKLEDVTRYGVLPGPPRKVPTASRSRSYSVETLLETRIVGNRTNGALVVETASTPTLVHGRQQLSRVGDITGAGVSLLCKRGEAEQVSLSRAVFLDTETTGLGTGTGTYVFLVGIGYVELGNFVVRQFFLRSPRDEAAFLRDLEAFLEPFSAIVSFNGRSFDWPLLENRYVLHRRAPPLDRVPHLDLLHASRRLWKRRLPSCSLSSIEQHVLEVSRTEEDVPGYLIPQLYFEYLRSGDGRPLSSVFYHNVQDILSLAALTLHLDDLVTNSVSGHNTDARDLMCLAAVHERNSDLERALYLYEFALAGALPLQERCDCLFRTGMLYKRMRRWNDAVKAWDDIIRLGTPLAVLARVEAAKYYEHVERDYFHAIHHVQCALDEQGVLGSIPGTVRIRDLESRMARLVNRTLRTRAWSANR